MANKVRKFSIFDKIVLFLNIFFSLLLLLSYLAPVTDPRNFVIIALIGFGYHVWLVINLLLIVYWLIRNRLYSIISAIIILFGYPVFALNYGFHFNNKPAAKTLAIRVLEYNVHGLKGLDKNENKPILDSVAKLVKMSQPDMVDFEEFSFQSKDSLKTVNSIKNALGFNYIYFKSFLLNKWLRSGNAIFSKYPIIDSGCIDTASILNIKGIFADIKYRDKILRMYCIHLCAVEMAENDKRKYLSGEINLNKLSFIIGSLRSAFLKRSYQVDKIKDHMEKCPYPYIVAGDFNDTPISYAVNRIDAGLKNAFTEKGYGLGRTYFSPIPWLHIDYILASGQFDVLSYEAINKKLSDHTPVVSDLKLN